MFIESSSLSKDVDDFHSADSNLVVVYGKKGISFDEKGLENLMGACVKTLAIRLFKII